MNEKTQGALIEHVDQEPVSSIPDSAPIAVKSAFDVAPAQFRKGLERRKTNRSELITWIQESLKEGTDWGRIHVVKKEQCPDGKYCQNPYHFSKPSLWKAGAEKIVGMMGLKATWPNMSRWEDLILEGKPINQLLLRCELINDAGLAVSTGIGARGTDADYGDLNKAFKMAKKSSLIDAVLNCAGLSEIFTQDVEDMDPDKIAPGSPDPHNPHEQPTAQVFPQGHQKPLATHCPIGKEWRGVPWEEVETGFIEWIAMKIDDKPDLVERAREELRKRHTEPEDADQRRRDDRVADNGKSLGDYAREIGNATTVDALLAIQDELPEKFEPGLRNYLNSRLNELGPS